MTLMELIEAYADKRHTNGAHYYNTVTLEARTAVVEAVEKLERDAARYRWICKRDHEDHMWVDYSFDDFKEARDKRIDAAMEATNGQGT